MELSCVLGADWLPDLHDELHDIRHKWKNFGVQIGLDLGTLQAIKSENTDNGDALREVLTKWLKTSPTWQTLNKALRSRPVGEPGIAQRIANRMSSGSATDSQTHEVHHCSHYIEGPPPRKQQAFGDGARLPQNLMWSPTQSGPTTVATTTSEVIECQNPRYTEGLLPNLQLPPVTLDSKFSMMKMPSISSQNILCDFEFKVVIVGESGVGKTSILNRFLKPETLVSDTVVTVDPIRPEGTVVIRVKHEVLSSVHVKLSIWDTAGMERLFHHIPDQTFRNMDAALVVFDVGTKRSFLRAVSDTRPRAESGQPFGRYTTNSDHVTQKSWIKTVNHKAGDVPPVKILVGNMIDKPKRQVNETDANEMAARLDIQYIETSSLECINIDKVFFTVTDLLLDRAAKLTLGTRRISGINVSHTTNRHRRPKCRC